MSTKILCGFQEAAGDSGVGLFTTTKGLLDAAGLDQASREVAINHNGYLLIEAPTGAGKTLIAGTVVERFSREEDVVWFWFAPFKGVVGQTVAGLRDQFHGLRLRELAEDRAAETSRKGDVFVTTWQAVATRVKDKRNVRKDGETNPSIDTLIASLRDQGLRIGVVVDEAHHGFGEDTLASKFVREVLKPEYTILITATPDDADVKKFEKTMGIAELQRIRVSRTDAVDAGLIKSGVKCAAYFVAPENQAMVDLQATALRDGVAAHRGIKKMLAEKKIPLVPLLLVQAKTVAGVKDLKARLLRMGFTEEQIAVHTAEEPDADLLALANDEKREVLIFVMAVALGFDAPRAFTLVSMRAARDADFGVQLVGRILRVHRRLHARARAKTLPEPLNYGYVFLADADSQTGLDQAGQRINAIQTEYAKASTATVVMRLGTGGATGVSRVEASGQTGFFGLDGGTSDASTEREDADAGVETEPGKATSEFDMDFGSFFGMSEEPEKTEGSKGDGGARPEPVSGGKKKAGYCYILRAGMPRHFKTQVVSGKNEVTEEDCAQRFIVSTKELFEVVRNKIAVEKRTLDVFAHTVQTELNFAADLSPERAAVEAQRILFKNKTFDPRELRRALLRKMEQVMREEVMGEADDPNKVAFFLDVILATHPELLFEAQKAANAMNAEILDAEELPAEIVSEEPLPHSKHNVYGVLPAGLNTWERPFAELLDRDALNIVKWWHRNEPRKQWSVNVLMPDGRGFYPDFVIGIAGRKTDGNALLADPKFYFQRDDEAEKVLAEHRLYGRVMILYREEVRWMTVGYDERRQKPVPMREFHLSDAAGF